MNRTSNIYDEIYNSWIIIAVESFTWIVSQTLGNIFLLSMIRVEENLSVRSILDHLISIGIRLAFLFNLFHTNHAMAKMIFGYLGEFVCTCVIGVIGAVEFLANLIFIEYCAMKIAYLFVKNIFSINEDFINHFLDVFNISIAIWYGSTLYAMNDFFLDPRVSFKRIT